MFHCVHYSLLLIPWACVFLVKKIIRYQIPPPDGKYGDGGLVRGNAWGTEISRGLRGVGRYLTCLYLRSTEVCVRNGEAGRRDTSIA